MQMFSNTLPMFAAGLIIVRNNVDFATTKILVVFFSPFTRAHRIRGCNEPSIEKVLNVLFALANENRTIRAIPEVRKTIGDKANSLGIPCESPVPIGLPLRK